jgi:hypothetical protein
MDGRIDHIKFAKIIQQSKSHERSTNLDAALAANGIPLWEFFENLLIRDNYMKKLLYTLLIAFAPTATAVLAQEASYIVEPNPVIVTGPVSQIETVADGKIHNPTNAPITIRWTRHQQLMGPGMSSLVCDCNLCYVSTVSTMDFIIAPGDTCDLDVHFLTQPDIPSSGIVTLHLENLGNPADTLNAVFYYNLDPSATDEPLPAANVQLFPNPVVDHFTLYRADAVSAVRVLSLDGRLIERFAAAPGQTYSLLGQPAGTYVVALEDGHGRLFQTMMVKKD